MLALTPTPGLTKLCEVCQEVHAIYGTVESVAPWLCKCIRSVDWNPIKITKQKNIYGCCGPLKTRTLKLSGRQLQYCDCE